MTVSSAESTRFALKLDQPASRSDLLYPPKHYRKSWNRDEIVALFPEKGIRILDIGAGPTPFRPRPQDTVVSVDFEPNTTSSIACDVTKEWPFESESFDFVYMSHVVEHFYPADRDAVIRRVYDSLRPLGLLFIRVPHQSHIQATGWEHHTVYGLNGSISLCHGQNPQLPCFRSVSVGVALSLKFFDQRPIGRRALERMLNSSWGLTETFLSKLIGGIPEVQYLLQRPSESDLRALGLRGPK